MSCACDCHIVLNSIDCCIKCSRLFPPLKEKTCSNSECKCPQCLDKRISELKRKLEEQMEIFKCQFSAQHYRESKKPHKCPVCEGSGKDKNKLVAEPYDNNIKILVEPPCHSCEGKGIVWG